LSLPSPGHTQTLAVLVYLLFPETCGPGDAIWYLLAFDTIGLLSGVSPLGHGAHLSGAAAGHYASKWVGCRTFETTRQTSSNTTSPLGIISRPKKKMYWMVRNPTRGSTSMVLSPNKPEERMASQQRGRRIHGPLFSSGAWQH
jgi:hypothetical protein